MNINMLFLIPFIIILPVKIFFSLRNNIVLKYSLTPLTTISILIVPLVCLYQGAPNGSAGALYAALILLALVLSLVGDIFNTISNPNYQLINYGGFFFLLAHVVYCIAFFMNYHFAFYQIAVGISFLVVIILFIVIARKKVNDVGKLGGVGLYVTALFCSLYFAHATLGDGISTKGLLATIGMVIFLFSDLVLAINLVRPLKLGQLYIWGLYAPGQMLIALSCFF